MSEPDYDVVVIGGGIHGVGALQAVAAGGWRGLLVEKDQLAHGTSSRSSKLIHGGLRYLETFQLRLVRESLIEREVLMRIAPDLVWRVPFHVPVYAASRRRPWQVRLGLTLYALLGGLSGSSRFDRLPREAWSSLSGLRTDGLRVVFRYHDGQTDDAALTRAVASSARALGARVELEARFVSAARDRDGYRVGYRLGDREHEVTCRAVVNAAGAWANDVLARVTPRPDRLEVDLVQGAHIVVPGPTGPGIVYVESPRDGRPVFVMPRGDRALVGTTETPFRGHPDAVQPLPEEIAYLQETLTHYFPGWDPSVVEAFAGLRVLPRESGAASRRSRELRLVCDRRDEPRLVTLYGGKLTGYRLSARRALDALRPALPRRTPVADTAGLRLSRASETDHAA